MKNLNLIIALLMIFVCASNVLADGGRLSSDEEKFNTEAEKETKNFYFPRDFPNRKISILDKNIIVENATNRLLAKGKFQVKKIQRLENELVYDGNYFLGSFNGITSAGGEDHKSFDVGNRALITGLLFLPTIASGFGLSASGKPYNVLLQTGHKLSAASAAFVLNYTAYQEYKSGNLSALEVVAAAVMDISFIAAIASGAFLTREGELPSLVKTAHKSAPWVSIITSALFMYLLSMQN